MDYSGPIAIGEGDARRMVAAGVTLFDHPGNPRHPTHWHVRDDGWMGAACCFEAEHLLTAEQPLVLRYLLHAHATDLPTRAAEVFAAFSARRPFRVERAAETHVQFVIHRDSK